MFKAFILAALVAWTHQTVEVLTPWADSMSMVCSTKTECARLAAISALESNFVDWVLDQRCNDETWRRMNRKDLVCDKGRAFGPWQIQDERMRDTSSDFQASVALEKMRVYPQAWTVWARAQVLADRWVATH
jgi:carbonic anhydrase